MGRKVLGRGVPGSGTGFRLRRGVPSGVEASIRGEGSREWRRVPSEERGPRWGRGSSLGQRGPWRGRGFHPGRGVPAGQRVLSGRGVLVGWRVPSGERGLCGAESSVRGEGSWRGGGFRLGKGVPVGAEDPLWGRGVPAGQRVPSGRGVPGGAEGSVWGEGELGPPPRSRTWALKSGPSLVSTACWAPLPLLPGISGLASLGGPGAGWWRMNVRFPASRLTRRSESALYQPCAPLCAQASGKAWFPSGPAPLQPHATPRSSFDFESLNMYLGDRWWKLITSCVLTEF